MRYKKTKIVTIIFVIVLVVTLNFTMDHHSPYYYLAAQAYFIALILVGLWIHPFTVFMAVFLTLQHVLYHLIFDNDFHTAQVLIESVIFISVAGIVQNIQKKRHIELTRLENYIDATEIGTWEWNLLTDKLTYNKRWYTMLGYTTEEFNQENLPSFENFVHPDDFLASEAMIKELIEGKIKTYDIRVRMRHKFGDWIWVRDKGRITKYFSDRTPWIISGSHQDVTQDVIREKEVYLQNERFNRIVDASPDLIYELDLDLNFVSIFGELTKIYRIKPLIGKRVDYFARKHEEQAAMHLEMSKKALSGEYIRYKWSFDFGDTMYYFESSVSAIKTSDGKIVGLVGVARNITEEKRIEDEKDYKDKFLNYVIQYSMSSIAIFDDKMNYIYVSQKFKELNHVTDEDILGKNHYELFPEIPERLKQIHQSALNGETFTQERDYIVRNDGRYEWMRWECRPWYKQDQRIGGIILYVDNLDEQIALEEEILTKSREIEATLESIGEAVISTDNQGNIKMLNRQAEELTGFHRDAVIGKKLFEVITIMDHQDNICDKNALKVVFEKRMRMESKHHFYLIDRLGMTHPIEKVASPILGEDDQVVGAVIVIRDISEKLLKQQEIEYLSSHDFLTDLYNRRYFSEQLRMLDHQDFYPLALLMLDLNGLKLFNDAYGHEIGDLALREVSNVLKNTFNEEEIVSRIGGDEFAVIIPNASIEMVEKKKSEFHEQLKGITIQNIQLTVAIGYELKRYADQKIEEILKVAENYMYRNKLSESHSFRNHAIKAILKTLTDKYDAERIHSQRVSEISVKIGQAMGLKHDDLKELELAGLYHDIGKISIPDAILDKPGRLTDEEYEKMKTHTEAGYQILKAADEYSNLAEYALTHHERWDGKGYPRKIKDKGIPLFSRIIAVADTYEAMTSDRVYRKKLTREDAILEIKRCAGSQFDPKIAKVFIEKVLNEPWK